MTHLHTLALSRTLAEPALARQFLRERLNGWPARTCDDALVMVSELVSNVVRHGVAPGQLAVQVTDRTVRVEVFDAGAAFPRPPALPVPTRGSGRGLFIVAALASSWGVRGEARTDLLPPGKVVWFELIIGVPSGV